MTNGTVSAEGGPAPGHELPVCPPVPHRSDLETVLPVLAVAAVAALAWRRRRRRPTP